VGTLARGWRDVGKYSGIWDGANPSWPEEKEASLVVRKIAMSFPFCASNWKHITHFGKFTLGRYEGNELIGRTRLRTPGALFGARVGAK